MSIHGGTPTEESDPGCSGMSSLTSDSEPLSLGRPSTGSLGGMDPHLAAAQVQGLRSRLAASEQLYKEVQRKDQEVAHLLNKLEQYKAALQRSEEHNAHMAALMVQHSKEKEHRLPHKTRGEPRRDQPLIQTDSASPLPVKSSDSTLSSPTSPSGTTTRRDYSDLHPPGISQKLFDQVASENIRLKKLLKEKAHNGMDIQTTLDMEYYKEKIQKLQEELKAKDEQMPQLKQISNLGQKGDVSRLIQQCEQLREKLLKRDKQLVSKQLMLEEITKEYDRLRLEMKEKDAAVPAVFPEKREPPEGVDGSIHPSLQVTDVKASKQQDSDIVKLAQRIGELEVERNKLKKEHEDYKQHQLAQLESYKQDYQEQSMLMSEREKMIRNLTTKLEQVTREKNLLQTVFKATASQSRPTDRGSPYQRSYSCASEMAPLRQDTGFGLHSMIQVDGPDPHITQLSLTENPEPVGSGAVPKRKPSPPVSTPLPTSPNVYPIPTTPHQPVKPSPSTPDETTELECTNCGRTFPPEEKAEFKRHKEVCE